MKNFFPLLFCCLNLTWMPYADAGVIPDSPDEGCPEVGGSWTEVDCFAYDGQYVYVGGTFSSADGVARECLFAFDARTGEVDPDWNPNIDTSACLSDLCGVYEMCVYGDKLYVGGHFVTVNDGIERNNLAAFELAGNGNTGLVDPNWDPDIQGSVGSITSDGNYLYVGGVFAAVNGDVTRNNLAAFELAGEGRTGRVEPNWDPNLVTQPFYKAVADMEIYDGKIYATGRFTAVNGSVSRNYLAAFELAGGGRTGVVDPDWDPQIGAPGYGRTLEIAPPYIYVGGLFTTVNGSVQRYSVAAFELAGSGRTGTVVSTWAPILTSPPYSVSPSKVITSLDVDGENVYLWGAFTAVEGPENIPYLAVFDSLAGISPGTLDFNWIPMADLTSNTGVAYPYCGLKVKDGVLTGGRFDTVAGESHRGLVSFGVVQGAPTPASSVDKAWERYE